ncbi:hypothetical protein R5R35_008435 [Gryllus longicercus]|uniref:Brix domain-containing protein n=1 Tax=Gryllus longicercus TaxID=2509291 RepID=A0AAN9VS41_9ORTH
MSSDEEVREVEETNEVLFPEDRKINKIKNKEVRSRLFVKLKRQKRKAKIAEKKKRKEEGTNKPSKPTKTIESTREEDDTAFDKLDEEGNLEVRKDLENSEYAPYFARQYEPKVLITFSDNPAKKTMLFGRELQRIIPNALCRLRKRIPVKNIVESCNREGYTDILIINENMKQMNGLMVIHLPEGPTANFRLSSVRISKELRRKYQEISAHRPEVILNNFSTRLGNSVASMLAALFHYDPEFQGRRAVTFHNQRDYIFFRHHRYEFKKGEKGQKVGLRELGPRFTLKLRWVQSGVFDGKTAEYDWIISGRRHDLETSRRRFFL